MTPPIPRLPLVRQREAAAARLVVALFVMRAPLPVDRNVSFRAGRA
jgi:hypothetical protein